jgi:[ribosomal protein S18]-alanine N-acetyltransferase
VYWDADRLAIGAISAGAILTNARSNSDTIRVASGGMEGEDLCDADSVPCKTLKELPRKSVLLPERNGPWQGASSTLESARLDVREHGDCASHAVRLERGELLHDALSTNSASLILHDETVRGRETVDVRLFCSMEGGAMTMVPTSPAQTRVHIRWMIRRDMPEVLAIEHANFEYPWCEEEFLRVLRQRNCIGMVAEHGERIVGFMIYELHRNKIHVLDFATHAEFSRRGVGRQMIAKLVGKLSTQRRSRIALYIRETNLQAQLFFRVLGFRAMEVVREHYSDTGEDAYLMLYHLDESMIEDDRPTNRIAKQFGA